MEQNAPVESGIGSFAKAFGDTVAKGSENEGKEQFKAWQAQRDEKQKAGDKKAFAEDPKKVAAMKNPNGPQTAGGKGDPQLQSARKALEAIKVIENKKDEMAKSASSINNVGTPQYQTFHTVYTTRLHAGDSPTDAYSKAANATFATFDDKDYGALKNAHDSGNLFHMFQTYPQLTQEYPELTKYNVAPKTPPNPASTIKPAPAPTAVVPGNQSMGPKPPIAPQGMPPTQTAQAPMAQPKAPMQPPTQVAQAPQAPSAQPPMQMAQFKMPPATPAGKVGSLAPPNTMIPGQGPASGQDEEELDNTSSTG